MLQINSQTVDDVLELLFRGELAKIRSSQVSGFTLGAAVGLACARASLAEHDALCHLVDSWAQQSQVLRDAIDAIQGNWRPGPRTDFGPRRFEFFPVRTRDWQNTDHHLFESRFDAAMREARFSNAKALAGAFAEMADNIPQHSASESGQVAPGILGYHVEGCAVTFAVADVGRGVLESLQENPKWAKLADSHEALEAIVKQQASRRPLGGPGEGFKQLFRSIVDREGLVMMRSGNGFLRLYNAPTGRQAVGGLAAVVPGLQLSVTTGRKRADGEIIVTDP